MQNKNSRPSHYEQSTNLCDTKFKIVLLGDSGVGKTSIIQRFIRNQFDTNVQSTVGIDFLTRNLTFNNRIYRLQLWDTAGQQKYKALVPAYLRDAHAAIFVYDVSRKESLKNLRNWIQLFRDNQKQSAICVIAGTKIDLFENNNPLEQQAQKTSKQQDIEIFNVTAKSQEKVMYLFNCLTQKIINDNNSKKQPLVTDLPPPLIGPPDKRHCCRQ